MLSCNGIIAIKGEIKESDTKYGTYFSFQSVSVDTTFEKKVYHFYDTELFVKDIDKEKARKYITTGQCFYIKSGSIKAVKNISNKDGREFVCPKLSLSWNGLQILNWPRSKQEE